MSEKRNASIPEPTETPAALELKGAIERFNRGAGTRVALDDADRATLASITNLASKFRAATRAAWNRSPGKEPPVATAEIANAVAEYVSLVQGVIEQQLVTGGRTSIQTTPVLESETVRRRVETLGREIGTAIDQALELGRDREAAIVGMHGRLRESMRFVLEHPVAGHLVRAFVALVDGDYRSDGLHLLNALSEVLSDGGALPLIDAGDWRTWAPIARELIAENAGQKRVA